MNNTYGERIIASVLPWRRWRVSRWLPRARPITLHLAGASRWWRVRWWPRVGYLVLAVGRRSAPADEPLTARTYEEVAMLKRRQPNGDGGLPLPALPSTSTALPKSPSLREFISSTEYDDKTGRTPGYFTLRNRGASYELTVYDPDSGTRLVCRGQTLDEVILLVERLLGAQDAPWETDPYLTEQLARKCKRRKK